MPTYEYACPTCGTFEREQRITEPALEACPACGAQVQRLISRSSFALKGSGWYADGYASGGQGKKDAQGAGGCGKPACGAGACAGSGSALH